MTGGPYSQMLRPDAVPTGVVTSTGASPAARAGATTTIEEDVALVIRAPTPPIRTAVTASKPRPVMMIEVPPVAGTSGGDTLVIDGAIAAADPVGNCLVVTDVVGVGRGVGVDVDAGVNVAADAWLAVVAGVGVSVAVAEDELEAGVLAVEELVGSGVPAGLAEVVAAGASPLAPTVKVGVLAA